MIEIEDLEIVEANDPAATVLCAGCAHERRSHAPCSLCDCIAFEDGEAAA